MNGYHTTMWPTRMHPLVHVVLMWKLTECVALLHDGSAYSDHYDGYDDPSFDQDPDRHSFLSINDTIGTLSAAAGVGGGYPVFQPAGWAQTFDPSRPRSAPDARTTLPLAWISSAEATPPSYPSQYAFPSHVAAQASPLQYVLSTPPAQYAPAPSAATTPLLTPNAPTPTGVNL
ncbi:unnamed protein product [Phytophthora fragariaefolia]|uniref:Unnamed protein product n=1 Tax=Phytophthora fragariaefolia TaxID=1490495 RepID=A0A9W6YF48_9STRA|nr:unnamed protein product [Phytophthora fragariaefolia]